MNHKKIIAFIWKMNPGSLKQARALLNVANHAGLKSKNSRVVVFPPFEYVFSYDFWGHAAKITKGAQDCFWQARGPYTGQISPRSLKQAGISWVIIGHSEKRIHGNETNLQIAKKLKTAVRTGLQPLLCLGDDAFSHKQGIIRTKQCIRKQLHESLSLLSSADIKEIVFVYEPIWAISAVSHGKTDDPVHAARMVSYLKELLVKEFRFPDSRVLYGGSVNAKTVSKFLGFDDINGFLVGAASLKPDQVSGIIRAIENNS